ncbi:helix-turn-helix domain-containing protein [Psychrobacter sp. S4(2024)]|uniref:helix-turn-helix domain-containing protein n=1 Tax=Psychrobacter sp. S4(2024) TaxID=3111913 RepID=UPI002FDF4BBC
MTTRQPPQTYSKIIHNHMLAGQSISTLQAYDLYKITCLSQRISDLKRAGVAIQSRMTKQNGKRFMLYWIEQPNADNDEGV